MMTLCSQYIYLAIVFMNCINVIAYDNGMAATPPMGWSTWCTNDLCGLRDRCSEFEVRNKAGTCLKKYTRRKLIQFIIILFSFIRFRCDG